MNYQSKAWMKRISKFRKYKNQAKGEASGKARLNTRAVIQIMNAIAAARNFWCFEYSISERHWYHIRAGKRWSHL